MFLAFFLPSIFALYALIKRKITLPGIIFDWLAGLIIIAWGDLNAFFALALTFILTLISDRLKQVKKDKRRNLQQMISNVLTPTLCIVLFFLTGEPFFYTMYYAVIAASLGDTLASSIGSLSRKRPVHILTLKPLMPGTSGGVTLLGSFAALAGGLVIGSLYLTTVLDYKALLLIILMGYLSSSVDSLLGALFQARYECSVCHNLIEETEHCGKKAKLIKGYALMDNNLVNLLTNIIIFIISYLLLS